eukprot:992635-Pyramimonas_sp.AAC.1
MQSLFREVFVQDYVSRPLILEDIALDVFKAFISQVPPALLTDLFTEHVPTAAAQDSFELVVAHKAVPALLMPNRTDNLEGMVNLIQLPAASPATASAMLLRWSAREGAQVS